MIYKKRWTASPWPQGRLRTDEVRKTSPCDHGKAAPRSSGFTIIEVLLSVVIIGIISAMSLPVYESFARRNDLDLATSNLVLSLRRAATYARGVKHGSSWGVKVQTGSIVLFKGTSFASRDAGQDETTSIPGSITVSGLDEIWFGRDMAFPGDIGTITLSSTINDSRTVTINEKGTILY